MKKLKRFIILFFIVTGVFTFQSVHAQCTINTINPGFELPVISTAHALVLYTTVPGWATTEADSLIEIWTSGFQGVPAYSGNQFIELNANDSAAIYQDFSTPCPRVFTYGFAHRGRLGTDVAMLAAGPPGGPYTTIQTASDGNTAWVYYSGTYSIPAGQTVTRFLFVSLSTSTGSQSVGNLLDSVSFTSTFNATQTHTDATCSGVNSNNDGTATIFPNGCTPYSYSWNTSPVQTTPTASGLPAGTYICVTTDTNFCTTTDTVVIGANSAAPIIVNSPTICDGSSVVLSASGAGVGGIYNWTPATGLSSSSGATVNANPAATTSYSVTGTTTGGCTATAVSTVTVNQPPNLSTSFTNATSGNNGTASVVATGNGPFTYNWSPSGGTNSLATGLAPGAYTVTVTDSSGCQSTASISIIFSLCTWHQTLFDSFEYQTASPDVIPNTTYSSIPQTWASHTGTHSLYLNFRDSTNATNPVFAGTMVYRRTINVCPNLSTRISTWLTTTFTPVQCNMHIQILDSNNVIIEDIPSIIAPYYTQWVQYQSAQFTPTTSTVQFIMYTNIGGRNGNDLSMDDFLVESCYNDLSTVTINDTLCHNSSPLNLFPLLTDLPPANGQWSGPSGLAGGSSGTFNPAVNGTGSYVYISQPLGTAPGCPLGYDTVDVLISQPALVVSHTNATNGNNGTATVVAAGNGPFTYNWVPGGGTNPSDTGLASGTYTVTVTDVSGCTNSASVFIDTSACVSAIYNSVQVRCNGAHNGTAVIHATGGTSAYQYFWTPNVSSDSTASNLAPGIYSVTVKSCTANLVANGDFSAGNIGFSTAYTNCNSANCLYPAPAAGSYSIGPDPHFFHQDFTAIPPGNPSPSAGNMMIVNGASTANTSVWCQTVNGILPNTNYNFSAWVSTMSPASTIGGAQAQLQFSINGVNLGTVFQAPNVVNTWAQFSATWNSGALTTANICIVDQNISPGGNDYALDDISFLSCDACLATLSFSITEPTAIQIQKSSIATTCGQSNGTATVVVSGGTQPYHYNWSPSGGTTASVSGVASGVQTIIVTDTNGCIKTDTVHVLGSVPFLPDAGPAQSICAGSSTALNATGGTSYHWFPATSNDTLPDPIVTPLTSTYYHVTATSGNCTAADSVLITVIPSPVITFTIDPLHGTPPLLVHFNSNAPGATSYQWNFGDSVYSNNKDTSHTYLLIGTYNGSLVVNNANNCPDTVAFSIVVGENATLIIPNVFTPNNDGYNDVWSFKEEGIQTISTEIFNRWGKKIYDWNQINGSWDGKSLSGDAVSEGTYYYVVKANGSDGKAFDMHGTVTLIRNSH